MKLRVLGRTYSIEYVDSDILQGLNTDGMCLPQAGRIVIAKGLPADVERETRLHEVNHAIYTGMALEQGTADEERIVDAFAKGWAAILADNDAKTIRELLR